MASCVDGEANELAVTDASRQECRVRKAVIWPRVTVASGQNVSLLHKNMALQQMAVDLGFDGRERPDPTEGGEGWYRIPDSNR